MCGTVWGLLVGWHKDLFVGGSAAAVQIGRNATWRVKGGVWPLCCAAVLAATGYEPLRGGVGAWGLSSTVVQLMTAVSLWYCQYTYSQDQLFPMLSVAKAIDLHLDPLPMAANVCVFNTGQQSLVR